MIYIVIPTFNEKKFVKDLIERFSNQTISSFKVIVSDNGGNPESVNYGKWGTLIKSNLPKILAKTLYQKKFFTLSSTEQKKFSEFTSITRKEENFFQLYNKLLSNKHCNQ